MRFFGFTPKILATSVALHTTVLATVGYLRANDSHQGHTGRMGSIGLRFVDGGGAASSHQPTLKSALPKRIVAATRRSHLGVATQQTGATAQPQVPRDGGKPQEPSSAPHAGANVGPSEPTATAGDGFEPTLGLKLVNASIVMPPYTDDARLKRFEGTLVVEVKTDAEGHVIEARLTNPSGLDLDAGVLAAARMAIYEPPVASDGSRAAGRARLKFRFHLEPDAL